MKKQIQKSHVICSRSLDELKVIHHSGCRSTRLTCQWTSKHLTFKLGFHIINYGERERERKNRGEREGGGDRKIGESEHYSLSEYLWTNNDSEQIHYLNSYVPTKSVPTKFICWNPYAQCDGIRRWAFWASAWVMGMDCSWMELALYKRPHRAS